MLRTTISRLKKVCSVAFVPRLLRGDQRYAPGKLEIFSYAVLKKAQKSTKSTDDDEHEPKKVTHKDDNEYLLVSDKEPKLPEKNVNETETTENLKESITPIVPTPAVLRETHTEKCQRIIDKAFGKEEIEPILGEQYYSTAAVNIDETRRAITKAELAKLQFTGDGTKEKPVLDERVQFGVFTSRDINKDEPSTEPEELIMNDTLLRATGITKTQNLPDHPLEQPVDELSFLKHSLRVLPTEEDNSELSDKVRNAHTEVLKQNKLPIAPDYTNILKSSSFPGETNQDFVDQDEDAENTVSLKEASTRQNIHFFASNQDESENKDDDQVPSLAENPSSPSSVQMSHCNSIGPAHTLLTNTLPQNIDSNEDAYEAFPVKSCKASDTVEFNEADVLTNDLNWECMHFNEYSVNATTAKEAEEKLTQKIEHIEETPLVEAHNPKLEGFNVTPKVLGNAADKIKNFTDRKRDTPDSSPGIDMPASYDEVAKRCLDTPTNQIDEILLKEMEKLGIPITGNRDTGMRSPVIENDLVQMDVLKKPRRPVEKKDLDLESHEYERGAVDLCETENEEIYSPIRYICKETTLPDPDEEAQLKLIDLMEKKLAMNYKEAKKDNPESVQEIHPNQVLIDPYDKKTIAYDTGEYDPNEWYDPKRRYSYIYVPLYKNDPDSVIQAKVPLPTKDSNPDNTEEEMTPKTPTMSPGQSAWFNEYTQRYVKDASRNLTFDDSGISEIKLIEAEAQKNYDKNLSTNYNYANMNDPSGFWQNPYSQTENQAQKSFKGQTQYDYEKLNLTDGLWQNRMPYDQSQQAYQQMTEQTYNYDYSNNPHLNAFSKAQQTRSAAIAYLNAAKANSELEALQTTQSASMTEPHTEKTAAKAEAPYYDFSNMNTPENIVNVKETQVSENLNMNAAENIVDNKQNPKVTEQHSQKVKSMPLLPPTFKIYSNLYTSQNKPHHKSRARPPKPAPLSQREQPETTFSKSVTPLSASELLHSFNEEERAFAKRVELALDTNKVSTSDNWHKIPLETPTGHVTQEQVPNIEPVSEIEIGDLKPETKISETAFVNAADIKFNTNTNVSDDIWDSDQLDPQSTMKLAQTTYAKVIENSEAETHMNVVEEKKAATIDAPKKCTPEDLWDTEQLDPKHVLTCNETCPIALRPPSIHSSESSRLQAIFEGNFNKADLLNYSTQPEPELESPYEGGSTSRPNTTKVSNLMQADSVLNPMVKERRSRKVTTLPESIPSPVPTPSHSSPPTPTSPTMSPHLPNLSEEVSLSELLRRVRQRNRMLECQQHELKTCAAVEMTAVAKCPRKAPRCPPTAPRSPPNNPVPPPSFGLPALKPRPRSCPPKRKPKSNKFSTCELDLTSGLCISNQVSIACPEMVCEMNVGTYDLAYNGKIPVADLTEDVIERLHNLGKMLGGFRRGSKLMLARDYEPWSPIPSWPPKKTPPKKQSRCEPGCKIYPPPRLTHDPPCEPRPCQGFPKKSFSMLDCLAVSLGDHKVYDLGEF